MQGQGYQNLINLLQKNIGDCQRQRSLKCKEDVEKRLKH